MWKEVQQARHFVVSSQISHSRQSAYVVSLGVLLRTHVQDAYSALQSVNVTLLCSAAITATLSTKKPFIIITFNIDHQGIEMLSSCRIQDANDCHLKNLLRKFIKVELFLFFNVINSGVTSN